MDFKDMKLIAMDFKEMKLIAQIEGLQKELDFRTEIENKAIVLISQCKFQEAIEILKAI